MNSKDNKQPTQHTCQVCFLIRLEKFRVSTHSQREQNHETQLPNGPRDYECHEGYKTCTRDDYENRHAYDWLAAEKEEITHKFRSPNSNFDGYPDPRVFSD